MVESNQIQGVADDKAISCTQCYRQFTWRNRKHHCRRCLQVFCGQCSDETLTKIDNGAQQKVRLCKNCKEINLKFLSDLDKNQPLLLNQLQDKNYFQQIRRDTGAQFKEGYNVQHMDGVSLAGDTITSDFFFQNENYDHTEVARRLSITAPSARKSVIDEMSSNLAEKSNRNQAQIQKYLKQKHFGDDNFDESLETGGNYLDQSSRQRRDTSNGDSRVNQIIDNDFEQHLKNMVKIIMAESNIDHDKWFNIMHDNTRQTVLTVRPTSVILGDSIDINAFVKIVKIYNPDQSKCKYIRGIVFKKDLVHKKMISQIKNPKILLLNNSLGFVSEDGAIVDLEREIKQETEFIRIIAEKIAIVKPDIIFVEKDVSRAVIQILMAEDKTVVTNTAPKMLDMIARLTQTIICPNSHFISPEFKVGECEEFKMMQTTKVPGKAQYQQETSLLCLEGCRQELGCTIILSGNDMEELKRVRHALKKCIGLARSLLCERDYIKFIRPSLSQVVRKESNLDDRVLAFADPVRRYSLNAELITEEEKVAPFLFNKMMERQSLIFEHFTLAWQKDGDANERQEVKTSLSNSNENQFKSMLKMDSQIEEIKQVETENEIKRKLKKMCNKPSRQKIEFYSSKTDLSVFSMIRRLATQIITTCPYEGCLKKRITHTDYWYHGNGSVEIKFKLDKENMKNYQATQKQLEQQQQILIYVFCEKCNEMIVKKRPAPVELLEMSFFKFLEQFFYNQDLKTTQINEKSKPCMHVFHLDSSVIFRYGPVKIMFKFEIIDEYTLDIIHFATTPGKFNSQEIQEKVKQDLNETIGDFQIALSWIDERLIFCHNWIEDAIKELPQILNSNELKEQLSSVLNLVKTYQQNFKEFSDDMDKKFENKQIILNKLTRSAQGGRIAKLISERISEYVFLLRKIHLHLTDGLFNKYFNKKISIHWLLPDKLEEGSFSNSITEPLRESYKGDQSPRRNTQNSIHVDKLIVVQENMRDTLLEVSYVDPKTYNSEKQINNTPSKKLKQDFKEIWDFDDKLKTNEAIFKITSYSAYLPMGYNQGSFRVKPYDFTSMIAMTINSNLYLSGLAQMDYMEMNEKILDERNFKAPLQTIKKNLSLSTRMKNQEVSFNKDQDILNQNVSFRLAEAELTKPTNWEMSLDFSTSHKPFLRIERGEGDEAIIFEDEQSIIHFFDQNEPIIDLGPLLEKPVTHLMFEMLYSVLQNPLQKSANNLNTPGNPNPNMPQTSAQFGQIPVTADFAKEEIHHLFHEQFQFTLKVYFPGHFEALRKIYCGGYSDFIQSFAESHYWKDNTGGKSRSTFFMSSDQRYVLKAVQGKEIKMFEEMSTSYFLYLKESFSRQCPTMIAKTLGIFKIKMKVKTQGSETFYLLLMENLLLGADDQCVKYDLKGSKRNRYITKKSANEVTLDNNFLQDLKSRPIPLQYSMKRILALSIHNDSLYLSKQSIIDYSMFVIINHQLRTVRMGIIDYIQHYTIEKQLESYVKSNMSSEEPTIIPPEPYKQRFRTAMDKYFVAMIPDRDRNVQQIFTNLFNAEKIQWFTKEKDKAVV